MLDRLKEWIWKKAMLQTEVVCTRCECVNNDYDAFSCKLKQVVIGRDCKCMNYIEKKAKKK